MEQKEHFLFFWSTSSPFSQWHRSDFEVEGIIYNCAEQYMMWGKAMLFGDKGIAEEILQVKNPRKQKALGRKVRNFDPKIWDEAAKGIVYKGNYAKFTQNEKLKQRLVSTAGMTLVEASPDDKIWGIGLVESDPRALNRATWQGTNWLGEVLTQLREDILAESHS